MDFATYTERFYRHRSHADISDLGIVREGGRDYPLLFAKTGGQKLLVVTSGFHGEEPAGPLTLLEHFAEIAAYAAARAVALHVYPCINPSGFEDGSRYNRSGERPNNDFLRYETEPGVWKGELKTGESFLRWKLYDGGPKETRAVRAAIERQSSRPSAALDIHQDRYLKEARAYAYVFGDKRAYAPLVEETEKIVPVLRNASVDEANRTDELGLIWFHDGSVTDYFFRQGVPYCATLETTTATPMEKAHAVNLAWIRGFIDLAARGG